MRIVSFAISLLTFLLGDSFAVYLGQRDSTLAVADFSIQIETGPVLEPNDGLSRRAHLNQPIARMVRHWCHDYYSD